MPRQKKKPSGPPRHAFADFIDQVISAATASPKGQVNHSVVRCWKKPNHRRCPGRIMVYEQDNAEIKWKCASCGVAGVIRNWQGTWPDLSELREDVNSPGFEIALPEQEYDMLKKYMAGEPEFDNLIYSATCDGGNNILRSSAAELKAFAQTLSFKADQSRDSKQRRMLYQVLKCLDIVMGKWSTN